MTNPRDIDWLSEDCEIFLNPALTEPTSKVFDALKGEARGSVWLLTSGTSGLHGKWVCLSKKAILCSAAAVNESLEVSRRDIWLQALKPFHVGGLAIWARASLCGNSVVVTDDQWNPVQYMELARERKTTLSSLVPTQVFDLVSRGFSAPPSLRAVVVGGDSLSDKLYASARRLGWPLLPSYGMTETSSQVATASLSTLEEKSFPKLSILSHAEIREAESGNLAVRSRSLLSAYGSFLANGALRVKDPKNSAGFFVTEDLGLVEGKFLSQVSRVSHRLKINGETVDLRALEARFESFLSDRAFGHCLLLAAPDARKGQCIKLVATYEQEVEANRALNLFNSAVLPYEKIQSLHLVSELPRNAVGKISRAEILRMTEATSDL
jgi:O-succinylbenzoic acid--CoA ligase